MNPFCQMISCVAIALTLLVGCATAKVDWSNRVGNFTYDQAVAELGTPDHVEMVTSGEIIADWRTHRNSARTINPSRDVSSGPDGAGLGAPVSNSGPRTLRLTFGADKILKSWTR
ncbi:MAG: hypothetical protein ABIQ35_04210 [Verrucomicrobiota bacterium]